MKIPVGGKTIINVPGWAVVVGGLIVDNVIANICKTKMYKYTIAKDEK